MGEVYHSRKLTKILILLTYFQLTDPQSLVTWENLVSGGGDGANQGPVAAPAISAQQPFSSPNLDSTTSPSSQAAVSVGSTAPTPGLVVNPILLRFFTVKDHSDSEGPSTWVQD